MSFKASHWAVHEVRGLRPVERVLLLVLAEYADDRDCAWPSQDRLADNVETSLSTLRRCLARLETLGLLTREHRWVMDEAGDTHRATNVYQLHVGVTPDWSRLEGGSSGARRAGAAGSGSAVEEQVPYTGQSDRYREAPEEPPVDNLSDDGVFVANADTGHSDGYGGSGRLYRSKPEGIPVTQMTGISTPNHQKRTTRPDQADPVASPCVELGSGAGRVRSGRGTIVSTSSAARARPQASPAAADRRSVPPASGSRDAVGDSVRGWPSRPPRSSQSAAELPAAVVELLGDCLPDLMLDGLDPEGALRIAQLLRERLDAGWEPRQIRKALDQNLPAKVSRLSGLVASRLRLNVDPSLAPNKVRADAERRRREAAQRRSDAIAAPDRPQHDLALEAALTRVRQRMPGASWPEQVEAAWKIVNSSSTDVSKEAP